MDTRSSSTRHGKLSGAKDSFPLWGERKRYTFVWQLNASAPKGDISPFEPPWNGTRFARIGQSLFSFFLFSFLSLFFFYLFYLVRCVSHPFVGNEPFAGLENLVHPDVIRRELDIHESFFSKLILRIYRDYFPKRVYQSFEKQGSFDPRIFFSLRTIRNVVVESRLAGGLAQIHRSNPLYYIYNQDR